MRISHPESPLYLDIKDDLRERDVMKWHRSLRAWRKREGVAHIPLSELSQNEYNLAVVSACIDAGWVLDRGRLPFEEDEQLIAPSQEGYQLPQAGNTDALLAPELVRGVRVYMEPHFHVELIEHRYET